MSYIKVSSPIKISVSWKKSTTISSELFLSAFMLNREGKVRDIRDIVYYGLDNQNNKELVLVDKSITVSTSLIVSDSLDTKTILHDMQVELGRLNSDICHVAFVVYSSGETGLDNFKDAIFIISDNIVTKSITLNNNNDSSVRCVTVGNVERRHDKTWRFFEEVTTFLGGLELAFEEYTDISLRQTINFETFCINRRKEITQRNFFDDSIEHRPHSNIGPNKSGEKTSNKEDDFFDEPETKKSSRHNDRRKEDVSPKQHDDFFDEPETKKSSRHNDKRKEDVSSKQYDDFFDELVISKKTRKCSTPPNKDATKSDDVFFTDEEKGVISKITRFVKTKNK